MNLLQLTQRLHREIVGRAGSSPTTLVGASREVTRLADKIGDAWRLLQQEPRGWKWMRQSATVTIPADTMTHTGDSLALTGFGRWRRPTRDYTVRCLVPDNPLNVWSLDWCPFDRFRSMYLDAPPQAANPMAWSISPSEELLVAPSGSVEHQLKLDYTTEPTELVDDTDEPAMPSRHHMILVWRAMVDAGKSAASAEDVSRAMDQLMAMENNLLTDQADEIGWLGSPLA